MEPVSQPTVLIVDDEADVREFVGRCLSKHGYTVVEAASGPAALTLLTESQRQVDLLLTDIVMPAMDGRELARRFSSNFGDVKVLFMSGYGRLDLPRNASFLRKPFTAQTLLDKVRETGIDGGLRCTAGCRA